MANRYKPFLVELDHHLAVEGAAFEGLLAAGKGLALALEAAPLDADPAAPDLMPPRLPERKVASLVRSSFSLSSSSYFSPVDF